MSESTKKVPIGLQLYSVRDEVSKDLPGALESVAKIGYVGVEPYGYSGEKLEWMGWDPRVMRKVLDDNGLACCGMHLRTEALMGDNLQRTIEINQILGNHFLIVAADQQRMSTVDRIMELADILNRTAETLRPLGLWTGYHAHPFDFVHFDGVTAWEILFANTVMDVVMQMDNGNCANGDGDPHAIMRKFPGRGRTLHIKDYGAGPDAVIGEGVADWKEFFEIAETLHHPEWYVVEEGTGTGFDIPRRSLAALRRMGK
ncbi:MAG: sugar phosphate isomerase/epimerase [Anaerolineae bacterium]|jgi:sugar phosphate isomerase/epimerase|nr:sugar phosphate isomerase/epimerase [Anaerolineae bacterium]